MSKLTVRIQNGRDLGEVTLAHENREGCVAAARTLFDNPHLKATFQTIRMGHDQFNVSLLPGKSWGWVVHCGRESLHYQFRDVALTEFLNLMYEMADWQ